MYSKPGWAARRFTRRAIVRFKETEESMQIQNHQRLVWVLLAALWLVAHAPPAAADGDQYLGKWTGTYQGDNTSGHFELILERGSAGLITGTIAVSGDGGGAADYSAKLKSASFSGDT